MYTVNTYCHENTDTESANEHDWLTRSPDSPSADPIVDCPTGEILIAQDGQSVGSIRSD